VEKQKNNIISTSATEFGYKQQFQRTSEGNFLKQKQAGKFGTQCQYEHRTLLHTWLQPTSKRWKICWLMTPKYQCFEISVFIDSHRHKFYISDKPTDIGTHNEKCLRGIRHCKHSSKYERSSGRKGNIVNGLQDSKVCWLLQLLTLLLSSCLSGTKIWFPNVNHTNRIWAD